MIAACGFETWAPNVGEHSFTQSLISTLEDWGNRGLPLSAAVLHSEILSRTKYWNPRYHNLTQQERKVAAEQRKTPIHITVSHENYEKCIVLKPMKLPLSEPSTPVISPRRLSPDTTSVTSEDLTSSPSTDSEHDTSKEVCGQPDDHSPTVLITLALEHDQRLATSGWAKWLESAPGVVKHGRVEGIYKSNSILVLLTLPVAIWDLLPNNPAVTFISFVTSCELMKERLETDYRTLEKQPQDRTVGYSSPPPGGKKVGTPRKTPVSPMK